MKLIIILCLFVLVSPAWAKINIGKVYIPCQNEWLYFGENDIDWKYCDGTKIKGVFYYNWQIILFDKVIQSKVKHGSDMVEDITGALIETNRIECN